MAPWAASANWREMDVFATMPDIPVSEHTLAVIRAAHHRGISNRFPGLTVTVTGRTWRGEQGGCIHEAPGMGLLWIEVNDCPRCMMREWPGWEIAGRRGDGYEATDGEHIIAARTSSQLVCRLATTGWTPK